MERNASPPVVTAKPHAAPRVCASSQNSQGWERRTQIDKMEFAKAMAHLCALKRTTVFTPEQVHAWYSCLCIFPAEIINRIVIRIGLEDKRFPDLADVYLACRREAIKRGLIERLFAPNADSDINARPSEKEILAIAERLGLRV